METVSFVEKGTAYYQGILCFHCICLHSGSINSKVENSDNDFHYFLYAFLVLHCEKAEIFHFSVQNLKGQNLQGAKCVYFGFEFQYRKIGKYAFLQKKEGRRRDRDTYVLTLNQNSRRKVSYQ